MNKYGSWDNFMLKFFADLTKYLRLSLSPYNYWDICGFLWTLKKPGIAFMLCT